MKTKHMSIVMVNKNKLIYRSTSYSKFSNNLLSKLLGSNQSLVLRVASWYEPVQSFHQCLDYDFLSSMLSNRIYNDNLAWLIGFFILQKAHSEDCFDNLILTWLLSCFPFHPFSNWISCCQLNILLDVILISSALWLGHFYVLMLLLE